MPNEKSTTLASENKALKVENAKLRARNAALYKDCVSFAKIIKANSKKDEQIAELQKEILALRSELDSLKQAQVNVSDDNPENKAPFIPQIEYEDIPAADERVTYNPRIQYIDEETFAQQQMDADNDSKSSKKEGKAKNGTSKTKLSFLRIFVIVLLTCSILVSVISGISYLFCTTYEDYTVLDYRFASVTNNAMMPEINTSDVVLIKYCGFDGLAIDSLVVTTKNARSIARITDLSVTDGIAVATVEDKTGTYEVYEHEFVGKVDMVLPFLGNVVRYASANSYNYAAIIISLDLLFIACLLLLPSGKPKQPKFGKDYTEEDFII